MKNKLYWLCGLGMILAACQSDELVEAVVTDADEANFTITLTAPEAMSTTRTAQGTNSALGGLSNVDMTEYDLRYQLAVYRNTGTDDEGNATYVLAISPQVQVVDEYQTVAYTLRLTPNRTYKFVAWADFVKEDSEDDLHYDTDTCDDEGWVITCNDDADEQLNDESRDAYYVSSDDMEITENYSVSLELTRPFAKVRIIATDWEYEELEMPDNISISYYGCSRFTNIDLFDGTSEKKTLDDYSESSTTAYTVTIDKDTKAYTEGYDGEDYEVTAGTGATYSYRTLTVDYLMTDATEQTSIHFLFDANDGTTDITSYDFSTDIPIQRNYLTTIIGNLLTTAAAVSVWIDEDFDGEYTYPDGSVATAAELQLALDLGVDEITLTDDITIEGSLSIYSTTSTINLNGYTLTTSKGIYYFTDDTYEGTTENGSTLTINGAASSTTSAGLGTRSDDSSSNGKIVDKYLGIMLWGSGAGLILNNVDIESVYEAVQMGADPSASTVSNEVHEYQTLELNNSTLTTTKSGGYYAICIESQNSTVTLTNSTINAAGGGISNFWPSYITPQGTNVTLTDSNITSSARYCVRLLTVEDVTPCVLKVTGGTLKSELYNTIELDGCDVTVNGATIINTNSSNPNYSSGGLLGAGIALQSAWAYNESKGIYDNSQITNMTWTNNVSLTNVTYKLAGTEGKVYFVGIWDNGFNDYNSSEPINGKERRWHGSDGHTEDSQYSYTETTEE